MKKLIIYLLLEREGSIVVRVEELDNLVGFGFVGNVVMVISEEVKQFVTADAARGIAVDSLECRVRCKVSDVTEALS